MKYEKRWNYFSVYTIYMRTRDSGVWPATVNSDIGKY